MSFLFFSFLRLSLSLYVVLHPLIGVVVVCEESVRSREEDTMSAICFIWLLNLLQDSTKI